MDFKIEKVLTMNGGQGEGSYARNSYYQGNSLRFLQPFLEKSIAEMKIIPLERFCIADMGCAAGPNTLFAAQIICKAVHNKYKAIGIAMPELQVFFSDLPRNDFNLLFQNLILPLPSPNDDDGRSRSCNYFAAGVAGSFHNRLLPKNSLHFVHSSYSLHWLSRVPAEVEDKNSRSWNGERVFISKEGPVEVAEAYQSQFLRDFNCFLRARAEEVVEGGCMFLFLSGRPYSCPSDQGESGIIGDILEGAFNDMVAEGMIAKERRDSFNLPFFSPNAEEVRAQVEEEGSFVVKNMEYLRGLVNMDMQSEQDFGRMVAKQFRAILEGLIGSYFGEEVAKLLFEKFAERASQNASRLFKCLRQGGGVLAVLERMPAAP